MGEPIISKTNEFLERLNATHYYCFTATALAVGYLADALGYAGFWGMRMGAVVAGCVAYCFFNDLRAHESWWRWLRDDSDGKVSEIEQPIRDAQSEAKLMKAHGVPVQKASAHETQAWKDTRHAVKAERTRYWEKWSETRRALAAQGYCIAIGTFVWAFGDLPVNLIKCGKVTC